MSGKFFRTESPAAAQQVSQIYCPVLRLSLSCETSISAAPLSQNLLAAPPAGGPTLHSPSSAHLHAPARTRLLAPLMGPGKGPGVALLVLHDALKRRGAVSGHSRDKLRTCPSKRNANMEPATYPFPPCGVTALNTDLQLFHSCFLGLFAGPHGRRMLGGWNGSRAGGPCRGPAAPHPHGRAGSGQRGRFQGFPQSSPMQI